MVNTTPRGTSLFAWIVVFTILSTLFLVARAVSARLVRRGFYADDALVTFAYGCTFSLAGVVTWAIFTGGMGKYAIDTSFHELGIQHQALLAANITWTLGTAALKISVLWMYRRLFDIPRLRHYAYVVMIICIMFTLAFVIIFLTNCQPISQMWKPVSGGYCRDITYTVFAALSSGLAIDLAIVILPMPWVWKFKMPTRHRVIVSSLVCMSIIINGIISWGIATTVRITKGQDLAWHLINLLLVMMLELWLGIAIACIPMLSPLTRKVLKDTSDTPFKFKVTTKSPESRTGGNRGIQLGTFGSTKLRKSSRDMYTELDSSQDGIRDLSHAEDDPECQLPTVPAAATGKTTTEVVYDPTIAEKFSLPKGREIYIRREVDMEYERKSGH